MLSAVIFEILVIIIYLKELAGMIFFLADTVRRKSTFKWTYLTDLLGALMAIIFYVVFNFLPGMGLLPDVYWLGCAFLSAVACAVFILLIVVTCLIHIVVTARRSKGKGREVK